MNRYLTTGALSTLALGLAAPVFAGDLSFWSWRQEDKAAYEALIAQFEAANPDINVTFEAFEAANYNTVLSTALAGEAGPDIMQARAYGAFETVAGAGYLMELNAEIVPALANFPAPALVAETLRADGKVYAIPFASQTQFVLYNKTIFDQLGLSEPETWADLITTAEAIKAAGLLPFGNGTGTAWQAETISSGLISSVVGPEFYAEIAAGTTTFNDPRYVAGLEALKEISAYFPEGFTGLDYPSSQLLFTSGMAAMFAGGSYEVANFLGQNADLDIGVFPAPGVTADAPKLVGLYFDGGYAANAKTKNPDDAVKFLNFLASQEFGQSFANTLGNISPIPGVTFDNPILQEISELNANSVPYIMLTNFRYQEPTGSSLLQAEVQKLLGGATDAASAAKAVTDGIATYHVPFQK